jgi:hypothetical protein
LENPQLFATSKIPVLKVYCFAKSLHGEEKKVKEVFPIWFGVSFGRMVQGLYI